MNHAGSLPTIHSDGKHIPVGASPKCFLVFKVCQLSCICSTDEWRLLTSQRVLRFVFLAAGRYPRCCSSHVNITHTVMNAQWLQAWSVLTSRVFELFICCAVCCTSQPFTVISAWDNAALHSVLSSWEILTTTTSWNTLFQPFDLLYV